MPTKENLAAAALTIATVAHDGQVDRAGAPYIDHPREVARIAVTLIDDWIDIDLDMLEAVALLHDVVEDAPTEAERIHRCTLIAAECGTHVYRQVAILTHDPSETYAEYIGQIAAAPYIVRLVKRADLRHNGDLTRLPTVTAADRQRADKYAVAELLLARCGTV